MKTEDFESGDSNLSWFSNLSCDMWGKLCIPLRTLFVLVKMPMLSKITLLCHSLFSFLIYFSLQQMSNYFTLSLPSLKWTLHEGRDLCFLCSLQTLEYCFCIIGGQCISVKEWICFASFQGYCEDQIKILNVKGLCKLPTVMTMPLWSFSVQILNTVPRVLQISRQGQRIIKRGSPL